MEGLVIDGEVYYVDDIRDFIELVDRFMGMDSSRYLSEYINDCESDISYLSEEIEKLQEED